MQEISFQKALTLVDDIERFKHDSDIKPGDKVKINYDKITDGQKWTGVNPKYKEFIEAHKDEVFTAEETEKKHANIFQLAEDDSEAKWLFWGGHLIKVKEEEENTDGHN